jgi:glucose-6-phosphate-specific signal transduction histidine kinase
VKGSTEHWKVWGQYIAVVGAYALCYDLALHLSSSHWLLTAGLRLSCLMLIPSRYWPSLALGEFLPLVENALLCMSHFSVAWAVVASVPTIALYMVWMSPMRRRWSLYSSDGHLAMRYLLTAALCCALTNALRDTAAVLTLLLTTGTAWASTVSLTTAFSSYLLGAYLGALTVVPTILALHERALSMRPSVAAVWRSTLFRDTVMAVIPVVAGLAWWVNVSDDATANQAARLLMILPVLAMTLRHRWHGAAIAGAAASVAMAATSQLVHDPAVIQCQVALAMALSSALWWGGRARGLVVLPPVSSD